MMFIDVIKILLPSIVCFSVGVIIAPLVTHYLYTFQLWKKKSVIKTIDGQEATITSKLHDDENKKTPRMGGIIIWVSVFFTAILFWSIGHLFESVPIASKLDFISRNQTWLPLVGMLVGAIVGAIDDLLVVEALGKVGTYVGGGLSFPVRLFCVAAMGLFGGYWFYSKLGVDALYIPFYGHVHLGLFFIVLFIIVTVALFSTSVIDGIDGLSGGIFTAIFSAYGVIAFAREQIDIAALCFVIAGGVLAFLWFNVPPATFYMTETGILALLLALSVIVFLTDTVLYLPVIALPLVVTTLSVIIQLASKKLLKRKIFLVAPLHHHFEAKGWPRHRIVMRYWIVSYVCALLGVVLVLVS
jgi:phospho-N-acetylmuramoyl-pentapeptide-transferase